MAAIDFNMSFWSSNSHYDCIVRFTCLIMFVTCHLYPPKKPLFLFLRHGGSRWHCCRTTVLALTALMTSDIGANDARAIAPIRFWCRLGCQWVSLRRTAADPTNLAEMFVATVMEL